MQKLLAARVRPYYIYRPGGRRRAVPHYVIDAPGRGGKIPLLPDYVEAIDDDQVVLRNYAGEDFVYKQPLSDSGRCPRSSSLSR
jgi:L-lysine 2,3-aminomutase